MTIKAIETRYAACRFRSRLEARWAVFFDVLSIKWHYELEGFDLPSGRYLPDFWLPTLGSRGLWFEVKPDNGSEKDPRWADFTCDDSGELTDTQQELVVAFGMPRPEKDLVYGGDKLSECHLTQYYGDWGDDRAFCICKCGLTVGVQYQGWANRNGCHCGGHPPDWRYYGHEDPRILAAYTVARSARFEHGDTPDVKPSRPF